MKKIIILVLSGILLVVLCDCSADTASNVLSSSELDLALSNPSISQNFYVATVEMPAPFEHESGNDNNAFYFPYVEKLEVVDPMFTDFANYLEITEQEFVESLTKKLGAIYWVAQDNWMQFTNLFTLIIEYEIPDEVVAASLKRHNEYQEDFAVRAESQELFGNAEYFRSRKYSEADIEALLSRDAKMVLEQFSTEYAIVIGDKAYAPVWLYQSTPEDYIRAGITIEMVEEKLEVFNDLYLTDEAAMAFEDKLSAFTGKSVTIDTKQINESKND